jgi:hypothetical protein
VKNDEKKKRNMKQKKRVKEAFIDQLQGRALIWCKADPDHKDHMKVGEAWEQILANLQLKFDQKVLEETRSGSITLLKSIFKNLRDNFFKGCKEQHKKTPRYGATRKTHRWHDR